MAHRFQELQKLLRTQPSPSDAHRAAAVLEMFRPTYRAILALNNELSNILKVAQEFCKFSLVVTATAAEFAYHTMLCIVAMVTMACRVREVRNAGFHDHALERARLFGVYILGETRPDRYGLRRLIALVFHVAMNSENLKYRSSVVLDNFALIDNGTDSLAAREFANTHQKTLLLVARMVESVTTPPTSEQTWKLDGGLIVSVIRYCSRALRIMYPERRQLQTITSPSQLREILRETRDVFVLVHSPQSMASRLALAKTEKLAMENKCFRYVVLSTETSKDWLAIPTIMIYQDRELKSRMLGMNQAHFNRLHAMSCKK